jgi:amidophosphoribosyltransferase
MGAENRPVEADIIGDFLDAHAPIEADKPQDECGVAAVYAPGESVGQMTYRIMQRLQHRGQSGAGMAYPVEGSMFVHRGSGLIDRAIPEVLPGANGVSPVDAQPTPHMAIAHTRYSTAEREDAFQPFIGHSPAASFALAHNGHIEMIGEVAERYGIDATDAASDSSLLTEILDVRAGQLGGIEAAIHEITPQLEGSYNLVVTDGEKVIGVRDPWGQHPMSMAELPDSKGYVIASETVAFDAIETVNRRDIGRGEIVVIGEDGVHSSSVDRVEPPRYCMFEFGYTARPESVLDGINVYKARKKMGEFLAEDHPVDADIVIGVPDSGLSAAAGFARRSRIPQVLGLFKDQYVGRSFIERGLKRDDILRRKLSPNIDEIADRRVVLVDDSLIKANTMKSLVNLVREAGATAVHVLLAMPQYRHPCYGGMDTRQTERLIARHMDEDGIASYIGADSVAYNSVTRIEQAVAESVVTGNSNIERFGGSVLCTACNTGNYPYPVPGTRDQIAKSEADGFDLVAVAAAA